MWHSESSSRGSEPERAHLDVHRSRVGLEIPLLKGPRVKSVPADFARLVDIEKDHRLSLGAMANSCLALLIQRQRFEIETVSEPSCTTPPAVGKVMPPVAFTVSHAIGRKPRGIDAIDARIDQSHHRHVASCGAPTSTVRAKVQVVVAMPCRKVGAGFLKRTAALVEEFTAVISKRERTTPEVMMIEASGS